MTAKSVIQSIVSEIEAMSWFEGDTIRFMREWVLSPKITIMQFRVYEYTQVGPEPTDLHEWYYEILYAHTTLGSAIIRDFNDDWFYQIENVTLHPSGRAVIVLLSGPDNENPHNREIVECEEELRFQDFFVR